MQTVIQFGADRAVTVGYQLTTQPCTLYRLDGYCNGSAGVNTWLQLFDSAAAPSTNDIPKKSLMLAEANGYSYTFLKEDMVSFNTALYLALSKDPTKFVAVTDAATTSGDATVEDLGIIQGATLVSVANMSSVSGVADIWLNSAGPKQLVQVKFTNAAPAATKTWLVFGATSASDGDFIALLYVPLFYMTGATVVNLTTITLGFGKDGQSFMTTTKAQIPANDPVNGLAILVTDTANPAAHSGSLNVRTGDASVLTAYYK